MIVDPDIPGADGVRGIAAIVKVFAGSRIIILSGVNDPAPARDRIAAGVGRFVTMGVSKVSLQIALQVAVDGEKYVDSIALLAPEVPSAGSRDLLPSGMAQTSLREYAPREDRVESGRLLRFTGPSYLRSDEVSTPAPCARPCPN